MGKSSSSPAPAAPDYAAANKAGVEADISTLPQRNLINAASTMGGVVAGGRYYSPEDYAAAQAQGNAPDITSDFRGTGNADLAHQQLMQQINDSPEATQALLQIQQQYGPQFAAAARQSLQATDPTGFNLRESFGQQLGNGDQSLENLFKNSSASNIPTYENYTGDAPKYTDVNAPTIQDTGASAAGRSMLETQLGDTLAKANTLDPALQRAAEQAARARGSASGNILGDSSALSEALDVQLAQRQQAVDAQNQYQNFLSSGQSTSDTTNKNAQQNFANQGTAAQFNNANASQAFNNAMGLIGQRNQTAQNQYSTNNAGYQQQLAARQGDRSNIQSFLGLQPIVSQAGGLSALQQGAAPTPFGSYGGTQLTNPNAGSTGAQWAGQLYGAQSQQYAGQQSANAQQNAGTMGAIGSVAGAALMVF